MNQCIGNPAINKKAKIPTIQIMVVPKSDWPPKINKVNPIVRQAITSKHFSLLISLILKSA